MASPAPIKCDRCLGVISLPSIGVSVFFIDRFKVCRACAEALLKAGYGRKELPKSLDTNPYRNEPGGNTLVPAQNRETAMGYFTVPACKAYVSKWLAYVAALPASQPRHYMRLRALPKPTGETQ